MKKIIRISILVVIILIILFMESSKLFAISQTMIDEATSEGGDSPAPVGPPEPRPEIDIEEPEEKKEGTVYKYITYFDTISGNAYEDLGMMKSGLNQDGSVISDSADSYNYPISSVKVQLLRNGSPCGEPVWVRSDGSYSFKPSSAGNYSVRFIYGDTTGANMQNKEFIKNVLQYNGQDYCVKTIGANKDYTAGTLTREQWEILLSANGATQINIVLDCSISMINSTTTVNGQIKRRIEVVTEAAEKLIDELLNCGENIYVGLIAFSGDARRVVSLTKNKEVLKEALDKLRKPTLWHIANTDVVCALNKAYYESFCYESSDESKRSEEKGNRAIILLSDGMPTKSGATKVYRDDSNGTVENKLNSIKKSTQETVQNVRNKGIKIFSVFTTSQDEEENKWVREIFENPLDEKEFLSVQDGQQVIDAITETMKEYCIKTTGESEYSETSIINVLAGKENSERRKQIDEYFSNDKFYYNNTKIFTVIDNYNATQESINMANELSEKTYMYADTGVYPIESGGSDYSYTQTAYITNKDGEKEEYTQTVYVKYIAKTYTGVDLVLQQRPALSLKTILTATAIKVTLTNGQVLYNEIRELGEKRPLLEYMDDELAHGSTVEVEYSISIKNDSAIQCDYLEMLNILPDCFRYSSSGQLLTENNTNSAYGWQSVELEELKNNGYISDEVSKTYANKDAIKITFSNNGQGKDGFYLAPGGELVLKFVTSTVLSEAATLKDGYNDMVEVLAYNDNSSRRMAEVDKVEILNTSKAHVGYIQRLVGIYPDNGKEKDCSKATNEVIVIPPTGVQTNQILVHIILRNIIVIVLVIFVIIVLILLKTRKELRKK